MNNLLHTGRERDVEMALTCIAKELTAKKLKKQTVQVVRQFYKHGNVDRWRAIFEDMLTKNPRTDDACNFSLDRSWAFVMSTSSGVSLSVSFLEPSDKAYEDFPDPVPRVCG